MIRAGIAAVRSRLHATDELRAARVKRVLVIVERFVYDLGLLVAGQSPDFSSYLDDDAPARLADALRLAADGGHLQPDFGEYAQVRIEGNILDTASPLQLEVDFEDRSVRYDDRGHAQTRYRRQVRITALVDPTLTRILRHRIAFV